MRLFIAINLNDEMKNALLDIQERLKENNVHGNYTKPENLHITLAFIGEYADPDYVLDTLGQVRFKPFDIRLDRLGSFGRLWWAGISAAERLPNCASQIRHYLAEADIPFDRKRFSPHITLIREPDKSALPDTELPEAVMTVKEISLMRSDQGKRGMIYTELGSVSAVDRCGSFVLSPRRTEFWQKEPKI